MLVRTPQLPLHICATGKFSSLSEMVSFQATPGWASVAWPANNRAVYSPVHLPARFTVARFMSANGSNATGNTDIGLYDAGGNRLISTGSTARAGTSVVQYIAVTKQSFPPGHYYLAMVCSSTTGQVNRVGGAFSAGFQIICGLLQEDIGSSVLPATMTPVQSALTSFFAYGFTQSDTL